MTFLGEHTLIEIRDLLLAKDAELANVEKTFATTNPFQWKPSSLYDDWKSDWSALRNRYNSARAAGLSMIEVGKAGGYTGLVTDLSIIPDEYDYQNIIKALTNQTDWNAALKSWTLSPDSLQQKGSLQDLHNRLNAVQPIPMIDIPQPTKGSDADLNYINKVPPDPFWWIVGGLGALFGAAVIIKKI